MIAGPITLLAILGGLIFGGIAYMALWVWID